MLTAQFVLVNVVIAVLMKHLEESNKEAKEEAELEAEMELEFQIQNIQSPDNDNFLWAGRDLSYTQDSPYGYMNSVKDKVDSQSLVHPMVRIYAQVICCRSRICRNDGGAENM